MGIELCLFEEGYSLKFLRWFLKLRFLNRWRYDPHEIMESWGASFYWDTMGLHLHWGRHSKLLFPFGDYRWVRTSVMRSDGSFVPEAEHWDRDTNQKVFDDGRWIGTYQYHYCTSDWKIQEVTATYHVDEMEWRWRWWKFKLPWPRKIRRSIDVRFSDEVGDERGSWKGGCIGCGYTLKKDETPKECIRRMERERKF